MHIEQPDPQDEGSPDRLYLGIDGTMGDAQDVGHPFLASIYGDYCKVCGLGRTYRKHERRCDICKRVQSVDMFGNPAAPDICEGCYRLVGVDIWAAGDE